MKGWNRRAAIWTPTAATNTTAKTAVAARYPRFSVMLSVSPAVSPRVVARILSTQKVRVTAGTFEVGAESFMGTGAVAGCMVQWVYGAMKDKSTGGYRVPATVPTVPA